MSNDKLKKFKPAEYKQNKRSYVEYYVFNPVTEKLHRKNIRVDNIKKASERKKYALRLVDEINKKLYTGWNPFFEDSDQKQYLRFSEVKARFLKLQEKKLKDDAIREETYRDYSSKLRVFSKWLNLKFGDLRIFELTSFIIIEFLDYVYIDLGREIQTRNNYLNFFRILGGWFVEYGYSNKDLCKNIKTINTKGKKERSVIPDHEIIKIHNYAEKHNKNYLLACYVIYYCFVRNTEISFLKLENFNLSKQTLTVFKEHAKSRKDRTVTLPAKVIRLMIDLEVFNYPSNYYLFGKGFTPSPQHQNEKHFRDYWAKIRTELKLPVCYKFYSQKDTGITKSLILTNDTLAVRDQAGHSNISITDRYTPHNLKEANEKFKNIDYDKKKPPEN